MLNSPIQTRISERMVASAAAPRPCPRRIRVGILLDTLRPPRWVKQILDDVRASETLSPVLLLAERPRQQSKVQRQDADGCNALLRLWTRLDTLIRTNEENAMKLVGINPGDYGDVTLIGTGACTPNDLARIQKLHLDVIVNLSSLTSSKELSSVARRGIWDFAGADPPSASFFWQQRKSPIVTDEIRQQTNGVERILHRALLTSDPESPYRAQNVLLWRRSAFLVNRLCALANDPEKEPAFEDLVPAPPPENVHQTPAPSNLETARLLAGILANGMGRIVQRQLTTQHWFIAVRKSRGAPIGANDMTGFKVIRSPRKRYYADPFVIEVSGNQYVFVEDYRSDEGKAVISYFIYDGSGDVDATVALETDYHLSYPFLFRWKDALFMMPETSHAHRVEVFKATEFPNRWQPYAVLLDDVVGYDPTLLEYGGKFWLFLSGVLKYGAQNNDLSIYYAENPFGPWHSHPGNPVVTDPRRARPAGAIFSHGGHLYRPGQDCWGSYGRAITVSRIEELSETRYREVPVSRIAPEWFPNITGTHTFNDNGHIQVIDGRVLAPRWCV
jgi:hypothetical protein